MSESTVNYNETLLNMLKGVFGENNVCLIGSRRHAISSIYKSYIEQKRDTIIGASDLRLYPGYYRVGNIKITGSESGENYDIIDFDTHNFLSVVSNSIDPSNCNILSSDFDFLIYLPDLEEKTATGRKLCNAEVMSRIRCESRNISQMSEEDEEKDPIETEMMTKPIGINVHSSCLLSHIREKLGPFKELIRLPENYSESASEYISSPGNSGYITTHLEFGNDIDLVFIFSREGFNSINEEHDEVRNFLGLYPEIALFSMFLRNDIPSKILYRTWVRMMKVQEEREQLMDSLTERLS